MKKWASAMIAAVAFSSAAVANTQDYKLVTVAGYLNFYLLNLNACEDFHPAVRSAAYDAEKSLYPYLDKLYSKMGGVDGANQKMVADIVMKRRNMLNTQIAEGDFTVEHCQAVVKILTEDGLDKTLLSALE
ncbi:hypothetical protein [Rheinheimera baltica]|uniref:Uncharacterized protein n=1 Tax=Rheinheimera baltica TaxID=67576 RepID=A0ABT9HUJ6_9GAMM|nr:hypothetical protein [Rheinheimera baltica]MDP5134804.1 hypothetical protein [Rheinheimera baltica]MDP5143306.1 hypothetical protein [Rheinheimera baltica]MDP5151140.1 hypothetical protein [Rheinheimera baltica]MDP5191451.1 hypothetical protein [Rheinheimera baltica]